MYAYIEGTITVKTADSLVVETGGIGYRIQAAPGLMSRFAHVGDIQKIHTYLSVREDAMVLYGFPGNEELSMFELLITVSGIGPKVAGAIVADLTPSTFALAVVSNDTATLTRAKGLGKKGAQRVILELKDKIGKEFATEGAELPGPGPAETSGVSEVQSDAVSALMVLGYAVQPATQAVGAVLLDHPESELEDVIRMALARLT